MFSMHKSTIDSTKKWAMSLGTSIDFGASGNLGQRFAVSRIGESAIIRAGVNVDVSRGTTGFNFLILPRFIPKKSLRRTIGVENRPARLSRDRVIGLLNVPMLGREN